MLWYNTTLSKFKENIISDTTMCSNKQCPQFKHCYRAQASPNPYWQSYAEFKPDTIGRCEYYWPFKEDKNGK